MGVPIAEVMESLAGQFVDLGEETPEDEDKRREAERYQLEDYVDTAVFDATCQPGSERSFPRTRM